MITFMVNGRGVDAVAVTSMTIYRMKGLIARVSGQIFFFQNSVTWPSYDVIKAEKCSIYRVFSKWMPRKTAGAFDMRFSPLNAEGNVLKKSLPWRIVNLTFSYRNFQSKSKFLKFSKIGVTFLTISCCYVKLMKPFNMKVMQFLTLLLKKLVPSYVLIVILSY